jgi:tripartite-type tricarboxylate transporter receptor subunit TctC
MSKSTQIDRRRALMMLGVAAIAPKAFAQTGGDIKWPEKVVRLINPWTPGGPGDAIGRPIIDVMSKAWKHPVIMDNKPGANATIGTDFVAKAPADGYTLLLGQTSPHVISPSIGKGTPYDPIKDFAPITQVTVAPLVLAVRYDLPIRTIPELIAYARANPGTLNFGSVGNGSTSHIASEMLKGMGGFDMLHIPYKGASQLLTDLMGGRISMTFLNAAGIMPYIGTDKMRPVAVTTLKRSSFLPNVPTIAETLPGFEMTSWYSLKAPAGTSPAIIDKVYRTVAEGLRAPEVMARYQASAQELVLSTPQQFAEMIKEETAKWAKVVKEYKISDA